MRYPHLSSTQRYRPCTEAFGSLFKSEKQKVISGRPLVTTFWRSVGLVVDRGVGTEHSLVTTDITSSYNRFSASNGIITIRFRVCRPKPFKFRC